MKLQDKFTSTGIKFWKNPEQMNEYKNGESNTIISTHISPEGFCNLNCSYCSVKQRKTNWRIQLDVIKDYVEKLMTRGLKAVILTGGGEPTMYPQINELIQWLHSKNLKIALITNGTKTELIEDWTKFSWVRVSLNIIPNWKDRISLPVEKIPEHTIIGTSFVDTGNLEKYIKDLKYMVEKLNAKYLRILPNCLLEQNDLIKEHDRIDKIFDKHGVGGVFFHQYKYHEVPQSKTCHQSYFRPYLSEVDGGTVYPCDSVVLNDQVEKFHSKYKLCKADEILEYLDKKILQKFIPSKDCTGCVFNNNLKLIDGFVNDDINRFEEFKGMDVIHEEFV
jgi:MoaA/NifB/PqqE/SkfB family radical SAM enzyme